MIGCFPLPPGEGEKNSTMRKFLIVPDQSIPDVETHLVFFRPRRACDSEVSVARTTILDLLLPDTRY